MTPKPFPQTSPNHDGPVLVLSEKHGYQIARKIGITGPSFAVTPFGQRNFVELTDVFEWWELPVHLPKDPHRPKDDDALEVSE